MRVFSQIIAVLFVGAVAVPLSARFVPGTHPWLDRAGLLAPLDALGLVANAADGEAEPGGQGNRGGGEVRVIAGPVQRVALRDVVSVIGSARGAQAVELSFGVTGRLTALTVSPGDRVEAGAVIAELDAAAAQLSLDRARLVAENAGRTVNRLDQLAQSATALQRQDAELALRTAELELQAAERVLSDHRLSAPVSGYVGLIEPQEGDLVSSSTVITRIEDRSSLILDFRVPERVAALVSVGDAVTALAISSPGSAVEGRIVAVDNRVDEASRTLRVQASIGNAEDDLRAGMAFQVDLAFIGADYPAVDPLAIQWGGQGAFLWIVRSGKAERMPIRILQRNEDTVLVEAELGPQDMVVTEGVHLLRPGAEVAVTPPRS